MSNPRMVTLALKLGAVPGLRRLSLAGGVLVPIVLQALLMAALGADALSIVAAFVPTFLIGVVFAIKLKRDAAIIVFYLEMFRTVGTTRLTTGMEALAAGDMSTTFELVTSAQTAEEVSVGGEFNQMKDKMEALRVALSETFLAYNHATERLRGLVGHVSSTATSVTSASSEVAGTSEEAGRASTEIAAAITEIGEGVDRQAEVVRNALECASEVAGAMSDSATELDQARAVAERVRAITEGGVEAAAHADSTMQAVRDSSHAVTSAIRELASRSAQIGTMVDTITAVIGPSPVQAASGRASCR